MSEIIVIENKKIIIGPENPFENEDVNEIIFEAFAEQHVIGTGKIMVEQLLGK